MGYCVPGGYRHCFNCEAKEEFHDFLSAQDRVVCQEDGHDIRNEKNLCYKWQPQKRKFPVNTVFFA